VSTVSSKLRHKLTGVLPPITTPFDDEGNLAKGGLLKGIGTGEAVLRQLLGGVR
jgi:hypothetical protein